jgi:hypothetical protein
MADRVLSWVFEGKDRISPAAKTASKSVSGLAGAVDKAKDAELRSRSATLGSERAALAVADARKRAAVVTKSATATEDQRRRAVLSVESAEVRHAQSLRKVGAANLALVASTKAVGEASETSAAKTSLFSDSLKRKVAAGAVLAGAAVFKFGLDAAHAASDMNESVSKSAVVFGQGQDAVLKFASTSAKSFGVSRQEAIETTATFGNFFEAMKIAPAVAEKMSIKLVQLGADLASFNNADPTQVLEDLRAGLAGEVEPLRKYGVDLGEATLKAEAMRLGLGKIGPTLTAGQKAQAAYSLILRQTTTAQGDFARTSSGAANQSRILSAQFKDFSASAGKTFLPVLLAAERGANSLLGPLGDLVVKMQELPAGIKVGVVAFGGLIAISLAVRKALDSISWDALKSGMAAAVGAVNPLNIILAAGAVAFGAYAQKQADVKRRTDELADALRNSNGVLTESVRQTAAHQLEQQGALKAAQDFGLSLQTVTDALLGNKDAQMIVNSVLDTYVSQQHDAQTQGGQLMIQHNALAKSAGILSTAVRGGSNSLQDQIGALKREAEATGASKSTVDALGAAQSQVAKPAVVKAIDKFGVTIDKSTGKVLESKTAIEQLNYQYDVLTGKNISADEAAINFEGALTTLSKSVRDNGKGLGLGSAKARENRQAFIDAAKAAQDLSEKVGDQKGYNAGRASMIESRKRLVDLGGKLHLTAGDVQALINKYIAIPAAKPTKVTAPGAVASRAAVVKLHQALDKLPPQAFVAVKVRISATDVTDYAANAGLRFGSGAKFAAASGGWVPGYSSSDGADNIPAKLTAEEFVVRRPSARRIRAQAPGLLEALNSGAVDVGGDTSGMRLRYGRALKLAGGGSVPSVQAWLRAQDPKPYIWGGVGPGGFDCSGLVGAAYGLLAGLTPYRRYFTTANFAGFDGFRRGQTRGGFNVGVNPGVHMAGSLGGMGFEAQSTATGIHVGSGVTPVSRFAQQWYLPGVGGLTAEQVRQTVALVRPAVVAGIMRRLGVRNADSGATLRPGLNVLHNATGRPEPLVPAAGRQVVNVTNVIVLDGREISRTVDRDVGYSADLLGRSG